APYWSGGLSLDLSIQPVVAPVALHPLTVRLKTNHEPVGQATTAKGAIVASSASPLAAREWAAKGDATIRSAGIACERVSEVVEAPDDSARHRIEELEQRAELGRGVAADAVRRAREGWAALLPGALAGERRRR